MTRLALVTLLVVLLSTQQTFASKILGVFPIPSHSHLTIMTSLTKELAARGHEVTVIVPSKSDKPLPNYREIPIGMERSDVFVDLFLLDELPFYEQLLLLWGMGNKLCEDALFRPHIQEFMHAKNETFDLVIVESFVNECFLGFAHAFSAPYIQMCPFGGPSWLTAAVGNPQLHAYIPDFTTSYNDHMTFPQRLYNTITGVSTKILRDLYSMPHQDSSMARAFEGTGNGPVPDIYSMQTHTALAMVNQHISLGNPKPVMPSFIEVGGIHIKEVKKLPKELQSFLDAATEGVVYFSMGSNLRSKDMAVAKRDALLRAFSKLKMKVLWKWEDDVLPGQPENVKLGKWLPQNDLLAHPNIKVFLTHCGLLGTQESVYHGIPVVCMPVFGDQKMNTKAAVAAGYGHFLDFNDADKEDVILAALNTVIKDNRFTENARRISRLFRDQPQTPMDRAVFWAEYVIRHKGAAHMRSAALDLTWYQYHLIDVLAVLIGGAVLTIATIVCAVKLVLRRLCGKKAEKKDKKKKN